MCYALSSSRIWHHMLYGHYHMMTYTNHTIHVGQAVADFDRALELGFEESAAIYRERGIMHKHNR